MAKRRQHRQQTLQTSLRRGIEMLTIPKTHRQHVVNIVNKNHLSLAG